MTRFPVPSPRVIGGVPANHSGEGNHPVTRVVIHSAVVACEPGMAARLAGMNQHGTTGGSWHYATDPEATIQCSYDRFVCWHAPPNDGSLGIEMADTPGARPTERSVRRARRKFWRWAGRNHRAMLDRTARLTAGLCLGYGLPPTYVGARGLRQGRKGWTTHAAVSRAFRQSTHWDPGWWPRRRFGRLVRRYYKEMSNA